LRCSTTLGNDKSLLIAIIFLKKQKAGQSPAWYGFYQRYKTAFSLFFGFGFLVHITISRCLHVPISFLRTTKIQAAAGVSLIEQAQFVLQSNLVPSILEMCNVAHNFPGFVLPFSKVCAFGCIVAYRCPVI
jgi:hypothetical protein